MNILGIDYGRSKIGVSLAASDLAEPLTVLRFKSLEEAIAKILAIISNEQVEKVIVGVSEGEMGRESEDFSLNLKSKINLPVITFDETLTSKDALRLAIEAGVGRNKRKNMEDAYAATIMLQNYLDAKI